MALRNLMRMQMKHGKPFKVEATRSRLSFRCKRFQLACWMGCGIFPWALSLADEIALSVAARNWGVNITFCRHRLA